MAHYLDFVARGRMGFTRLITHRFALGDYREAFLVARGKSKHRAVKIVFDVDPPRS
jgi:threonine dehydrogenase-like Zn-dependent dehydrogenase